jgi:hypothetical protein
MNTYVIGIDPGATGAAVLMASDGRLIDTCKFGDSTPHDIRAALEAHMQFGENVKAYIENVHSFPKQGVASSFKFGRGFGLLEGILIGLKIPYMFVSPQKWQKAMGCLSRGDKNITKAAAQRRYPAEKITHATADAILIARYGVQVETSNDVQ